MQLVQPVPERRVVASPDAHRPPSRHRPSCVIASRSRSLIGSGSPARRSRPSRAPTHQPFEDDEVEGALDAGRPRSRSSSPLSKRGRLDRALLEQSRRVTDRECRRGRDSPAAPLVAKSGWISARPSSARSAFVQIEVVEPDHRSARRPTSPARRFDQSTERRLARALSSTEPHSAAEVEPDQATASFGRRAAR